MGADGGTAVRNGGGHGIVVAVSVRAVVIIEIEDIVVAAVAVIAVIGNIAVGVVVSVVADIAVVAVVNVALSAACKAAAQKCKSKYKDSELFHAFTSRKVFTAIAFPKDKNIFALKMRL